MAMASRMWEGHQDVVRRNHIVTRSARAPRARPAAPDQHRRGGGATGEQRDARAQPGGQHVAAELVGAEPVSGAPGGRSRSGCPRSGSIRAGPARAGARAAAAMTTAAAHARRLRTPGCRDARTRARDHSYRMRGSSTRRADPREVERRQDEGDESTQPARAGSRGAGSWIIRVPTRPREDGLVKMARQQ